MKRCPKCGKTYPDEANFCPVDAGRLVAASTDAVSASAIAAGEGLGLIGGRFQIGPQIGGSITGEVHRAVDISPAGNAGGAGGGAVALKLVAPAVLAMPQVAQRIERELKQLERVQHRGVAQVVASGKHGDRVFVATELIEGARPLGELIAASGPIDAQRASEIVLAIGESLIEAAKVGVVHRDLAPKNILVTADNLRLINFAVPTPGDRIAGVPEFIAPEVVDGKPVDQRSNIYSLGAIYAFLLTGRVAAEPPSQSASVPADVDALVVRALEKNPAKRYLTLRQFLDEVERVAHGPAGGVGGTAPFGRAGGAPAAHAKKDLSATLMGFGFPGSQMQSPPAQQPQFAPPQQQPQFAPPQPQFAPPPQQPQAFQPQSVQPPAPAYAPPAPSPFQPPGPHAAIPAAAAMQQAAPAMGHPAPPPGPHVSAPKMGAAASGKKKQDQPQSSKGKFRETMWFKKGELDAAAAEEAAAAGDADAAGKADLLPIEERYVDDGTVTRSDAEKYSLRTGATAMMQAIREDHPSPAHSVSERELVGEMKGGRNVILIVIILAIVVAIGIVAAFVV